jgi:hypothetical protein
MAPNPLPGPAAPILPAHAVATHDLVAAGARPTDHLPGEPRRPQDLELVLIGHSRLMYWWPVWVAGYAMALATSLGGQTVEIGGQTVRFYPSGQFGVLFFVLMTLVITFTNITMRGLVSGLAILTVALIAVIIAAFGWWDTIFGWLGDARVYLNQGAYFWFSTALLVLWLLTVFVLDRFTYWRVRSGQISHEYVMGAGSETYSTTNMRFEKRRDDLFRHWLLGLGSGDLTIYTSGATPREIHLPNVAFVASKKRAAEKLIATSLTTTT